MTETFDLDQELLGQMREDFLNESQEILDRLGMELARLDRGASPDLINTIFREVHTLKGTAGFVALGSIHRLSHKLEDVFGEVRAERLAVTPPLIDAAFQSLDRLIALRLAAVQGDFADGDVERNIGLLDAVLHPTLPSSTESRGQPIQVTAEPAETDEPAILQTGQTGTSSGNSASETTLRVEIDTLDSLLNLSGELITARNALLATAERLGDEALFDNSLAINRLTRQLQTTISAVRLVPIERLLNRFTPIIRTVARDAGKRVRYEIEGGQTPLDRAISEAITDPLVHMIRNAIDHGLELPETRRRAGKPEEGLLRISAERRGDDVVIRVSDDGAGIDPDTIRRVAVNKGLYTTEQAEALSNDEAVRLIFAPGFSTSEQITDLSGRGVGMDVVLQNVSRLRGRIDIQSNLGVGTTFVVTLPLTLAILQVLLVKSQFHVYAVPLRTVRETLRLTNDDFQELHQQTVVYVRERPLPVHHLARRLTGQDTSPDASGGWAAFVAPLAGGEAVIVVDELIGKQQMVVKPLSPFLGHVPGVEGAAILPNGQVGLILDVEQLLTQA